VSAATGFPPIARSDARVLVLGSMPGQASLAAGQYYAHPRNAFWPILGAHCGFAADAPYPARTTALMQAGIAVWDVLRSCRRVGSLDTAIEDPQANDFRTFFASYPGIDTVLFNGTAAATLFDRHVLRTLDPVPARRIRLPSTSPAHAARTLAAKQSLWLAALRGTVA
jgi:hypoxanthine-DNA glycosylase